MPQNKQHPLPNGKNFLSGFIAGDLEALLSIVITGGIHGDEHAGIRAAVALAQYITCSLKGQPFRRAPELPGDDEDFSPLDLSGIRIMCVPTVNIEGISFGTRYYDTGPCWSYTGGSFIDLNRRFGKRIHPVTQPIWEVIEALPGKVMVLDCHGTGIDRTDDGMVDVHDMHVYAVEGQDDFVRKIDPRMRIVRPPLSAEQLATTLQGASLAVGHQALTIEFGRDQACPERAACRFFTQLLKVLRDTYMEAA